MGLESLDMEDYEFIEVIGQGIYSLVKKVKRKSDNQILVWKELNYASMTKEEKMSLVSEVNLLRMLKHPNIVHFYNHFVDRSSTTLFIFMEYCRGGDLKKLIQRCSKTRSYLDETFIWKVVKQICEALRMCHEKHVNGNSVVLHRDIKPANVFIDKDNNVKLGDFGLARTLSPEKCFASTFAGTPYYMSPEVMDGRDYNERSDIWSLGCLIYELCALQPPFLASNQQELQQKINCGRFERIPKRYSEDLNNVIKMMLTQEDFLRPSALMILYHSAVKFNTSSMEESLNLHLTTLVENSRERTSSDGKSGSTSSSDRTSGSLAETVKERKTEDCFSRVSWEESKKADNRESNSMDEFSESSISFNKSKRSFQSGSECSSLVQRDVECLCSAMTPTEWKVKIASLRSLEDAVKKREMRVDEREREMIRRERRALAMEQEAKQHLVRAQIYLKQARTPREGNKNPLKTLRQETDDGTSVSADIGYDVEPTSAYLDTQSKLNPFLQMRRQSLQDSKRCNTLDNPKSRKKHGDLFYLESSNATTSKEFPPVKKNDKISSERKPLRATSFNIAANQKPCSNLVAKNSPSLVKQIRNSFVATTGKENQPRKDSDVIQRQRLAVCAERPKSELTERNILRQSDERTFRIYHAV